MIKMVIYITPNCDSESIELFDRLKTDAEKLNFARNNNEFYVYTIDDFEQAFNCEEISDLGYIEFVDNVSVQEQMQCRQMYSIE